MTCRRFHQKEKTYPEAGVGRRWTPGGPRELHGMTGHEIARARLQAASIVFCWRRQAVDFSIWIMPKWIEDRRSGYSEIKQPFFCKFG
jgi:hypothetical protein